MEKVFVDLDGITIKGVIVKGKNKSGVQICNCITNPSYETLPTITIEFK